MGLGIKTMNKFLGNEHWRSLPPVAAEVVLHLHYRSFPPCSPLVVALESLRHEQLPEVLRGEFLHILAVVVNLPCWRVAT